MIEIMSERPAPAPYRVRNAIAALCLALQSQIKDVLDGRSKAPRVLTLTKYHRHRAP